MTRTLDPTRTRGLVWHTQSSSKAHRYDQSRQTALQSARGEKPTILLLIDRNDLEDQMLKNLASVGLSNVAHAHFIAALNRRLSQQGQEYRGVVVAMIRSGFVSLI